MKFSGRLLCGGGYNCCMCILNGNRTNILKWDGQTTQSEIPATRSHVLHPTDYNQHQSKLNFSQIYIKML
jgi:hypothetical protein